MSPPAGSYVGAGRQPQGRIRSTSASVSVPGGPVPGARLRAAARRNPQRSSSGQQLPDDGRGGQDRPHQGLVGRQRSAAQGTGHGFKK